MNINNPSLISLLQSSVSQETLQQHLPDEELISQAFSELLSKKIHLLDEISEGIQLPENLVTNNPDRSPDITETIGSFLPGGKEWNKELNLENPLHSLNEIIETVENNEIDIFDRIKTNLTTLSEEIETIKNIKPDLSEYREAFQDIVDEFQVITEGGLKAKDKPVNTRHFENNETVKSNIQEEKLLSVKLPEAVENNQLDPEIKAEVATKNIVDLGVQISGLLNKVKSVKESIFNESIFNESENAIIENNNPEQLAKSGEINNASSFPIQNESPVSDNFFIDNPKIKNTQPATRVDLDTPVNLGVQTDAFVDKFKPVTTVVSEKASATDSDKEIKSNLLIDQKDDNLQFTNPIISITTLADEIKKLEKVVDHIGSQIIKPEQKKNELSMNQIGQPGSIIKTESSTPEVTDNLLPETKSDVLQKKNELSMNQIGQLSSLIKTESNASEVTDNLLPETKPDILQKNEALLFKSESLNLIKQDATFPKLSIDNQQLNTKQDNNREMPELKSPEPMTDKPVAKFSADIPMLNRAVQIENKTELLTMNKPVTHPEWNKEIGDRVIWMHKQAIPSAELRLNPAHLGPITIKVETSQEQTTIAFTAQHAVVKEAIETAVPKLKEMFSAQQLNLVDVNVSQNDAGQKQQGGGENFNHWGNETQGKKQQANNELPDNEKVEKTIEITDEIEADKTITSNGILSIFA